MKKNCKPRYVISASGNIFEDDIGYAYSSYLDSPIHNIIQKNIKSNQKKITKRNSPAAFHRAIIRSKSKKAEYLEKTLEFINKDSLSNKPLMEREEPLTELAKDTIIKNEESRRQKINQTKNTNFIIKPYNRKPLI